MMKRQKNIMWYIKSALEIIQIFIFIICFIGFIFTFITMWFCQESWVNGIMAWSVGIGFINLLFLVSR